MGEKEIKPAAPGGVKVAEPGASAGPVRTQEKPGTGGPTTPPPTDTGKRPPRESGPSKPWSGSDRYEDGYRMSRNEDGTITLDNPDGTKAWWNPNSETWMDESGKTLSEDWAGGHRPTKHETSKGN
jgi:hypothetical protein